MNDVVRIALAPDDLQRQRLLALQSAFAAACNDLAPLVQSSRCWNRVALHHMAYRQLRTKYPALGSQMICNAIYSVSRTSRHIYQSPDSPFNVARLGDKPLPLLCFQAESPVYFDRHTLSLRAGQISLLTLDGRMRFDLPLSGAVEERFRNDKLREIVLKRTAGRFVLDFAFGDATAETHAGDDLPEYLVVQDLHPPPPEVAGRATHTVTHTT